MASYTPGPWMMIKANLIPPHDAEFQILKEDYGYIASTWNATETDEANARLIVLAPELLETLRLAAEALTDLLEGEECDHSMGVCFCHSKEVLFDIDNIFRRIKGEDGA